MPSASAVDHGGHHRRRRRRKSYEEEPEEGLPTWKLGMVVAVAVVCFGVLYPSMFHPLLVSFFNTGQPQSNSQQQAPPGRSGPVPRSSNGPRPGMHPAMGMAPQGEQPTSSGKGMFSWMLPLYTVGVVVFLVYTLFIKKKKSRRLRSSKDDYDTESDAESEKHGRMGRKQLHDLQTRLKDTELAMSKILEQIEAVSKSEQVASALSKSQDDEKAQEAVAHLQTKEGYVRDLENALRQFQELSNSYDKSGMSAERQQYGDDTEEDSDEEDCSSPDEAQDEEVEEQDQRAEIELEDVPEPVDNGDSETEIPEEPESEPVEEPVQPKKHVRRRKRRT